MQNEELNKTKIIFEDGTLPVAPKTDTKIVILNETTPKRYI